jgi:DNA-binding CsgD family transcriptional regulator
MQDDQNQVFGIIDPTTGTAKPNDLARQLYGLTDAEHELCVGLAAGRRLKDWARLRGVTLNTARAQVKSVLGKMGVTGQQDVVRIWLSLGAIDCSAASYPAGSSDAPAHRSAARIARAAMPANLPLPQYGHTRPSKADSLHPA